MRTTPNQKILIMEQIELNISLTIRAWLDGFETYPYVIKQEIL